MQPATTGAEIFGQLFSTLTMMDAENRHSSFKNLAFEPAHGIRLAQAPGVGNNATFFLSGSDTNCPVQEFFKSAMNNVAVAKQNGYRGI
jgi:hypothetical protein